MSSNVVLCYGRSKFVIEGYLESDFAVDLKKKSTTSYVYALERRVVSWIWRLQIVVVLSTTKVEYMATTQVCKEAIWTKRLLE